MSDIYADYLVNSSANAELGLHGSAMISVGQADSIREQLEDAAQALGISRPCINFGPGDMGPYYVVLVHIPLFSKDWQQDADINYKLKVFTRRLACACGVEISGIKWSISRENEVIFS